MIRGARYAHTNLIARDWRALASFYERVFGCLPVPPERHYSGPALEAGTGVAGSTLDGVHLRLPGRDPDGPTLEIYSYSVTAEGLEPAVNRPGFAHLAFEVESVEEARCEVLAAGGRALGEVVTLTTAAGRQVTWCYVADPEGNALELQSWSTPEERPAPSPPEPPAGDGVRRGYDRWAQVYDHDRNPLPALEEPVVHDCLGEVRGLRVLDLGCGTGRHALWLAAAGAAVTAVDFSQGMLEEARRKPGAAAVRFVVHDLHRPLPLESSTCDLVVSGRVLDLGCGTGRHALWLAAAGAAVTAVDFSEGMLEEARRKPGAAAVRFVVHDLHRPLPFESSTFDLVVSGLVLEHLSDLFAFFAEARRLLRADGRAVVSAMHPAMFLRGSQARFTDPDSGQKVQPGSLAHTLADMLTAALRAGFTLEAVSEHAPDAAFAARFPRATRYVGWPMLVVLVLRS